MSTEERVALTDSVKSQLDQVSGPMHFNVDPKDPDNLNPDSTRIAREVKGFANTFKKEIGTPGTTAEYLSRLVNVGNVHKLQQSTPNGSATPYKSLWRALSVVRAIADTASYDDKVVAGAVTSFMTNTPSPLNEHALRAIKPAYVVYTNKDCRSAFTRLGDSLKASLPRGNDLLNHPQDPSSLKLLEDLERAAKHFLEMYDARHQGATPEDALHIVSASALTSRLDKVASQLVDLKMASLAEQLDMVSNTLDTLHP